MEFRRSPISSSALKLLCFGAILFICFFVQVSEQMASLNKCKLGKDGLTRDKPCRKNLHLDESLMIVCDDSGAKTSPANFLTTPKFCSVPLKSDTDLCADNAVEIPSAIGVAAVVGGTSVLVKMAPKKDQTWTGTYEAFAACEYNGKKMFVHLVAVPFKVPDPTITNECDFTKAGTTTETVPCVSQAFQGEEAIVKCPDTSNAVVPSKFCDNTAASDVCTDKLTSSACDGTDTKTWKVLFPGTDSVTVRKSGMTCGFTPPKDLTRTEYSFFGMCKNAKGDTLNVSLKFAPGKRPSGPVYPQDAYICGSKDCTLDLEKDKTFIVNCTENLSPSSPSILTNSIAPHFCEVKADECPTQKRFDLKRLGTMITDRYGNYSGVTYTKIVPTELTLYGSCGIGKAVSFAIKLQTTTTKKPTDTTSDGGASGIPIIYSLLVASTFGVWILSSKM